MKTSDVVRQLCADKRISVTDLEKELGFSNGSLTKNNYLRSDRLYSLSRYFGVSMEYLMTGSFPSDGPDLPSRLRVPDDFIDKYLVLNDEGREKVSDYIDDLIASGKYKKVQALDA